VLRVGGVQLSVAEPLPTELTVTPKAGSEAVALPSLARITMFEYVPTFAAKGLPDNVPLDVLKLAQAGLLTIENVSVLRSGSDAVGRKLYELPTATVVVGFPEITGGRLLLTVIANVGNEAFDLPSVTVMRILFQVPTAVGEPYSLPVETLKLAHAGLFAMVKRSLSIAVSGSLTVGLKLYDAVTVVVVGGEPDIVGGFVCAAASLPTMQASTIVNSRKGVPRAPVARDFVEIRMCHPRRAPPERTMSGDACSEARTMLAR
jgi:hypothetical protein